MPLKNASVARRLTFAVAASLVTAARAGADENASPKTGISIDMLPQSVQVISDQDIADLGAQSIGDVLRLVPGSNPGYSRVGSSQASGITLRGFHADQMRNGIRQHRYEDVDASALSNIEHIDVLKGPFGTLYGQSAGGGIISIATKQPDGLFGARMSATVGSGSQKMITGDFRVPVSDQIGMRVTGEIERSGTFVDHQDIDRENLAFTLRYEINDRMVGHLVTEYVERRTQSYPGLPIEGTVAPNGAAKLERGLNLGEPSQDVLSASAPLMQAWLDFKLNDNWTLTPRAQYQEFNSQFTQIRLRGAQGNLTTINRDGRTGKEGDKYSIGQLDLSGSVDTGAITHKLLLGYEYDLERGRFTQFDITNVAPISVLAPVYTFTLIGPIKAFANDTHHDVDGNAIYAQDRIALTHGWDVVGSARHSWINAWKRAAGSNIKVGTDVQSTIWQLGTTLQLIDGVSLYGGYSTGFDIESSAGARSANGAALKPEESRQLEAGLRASKGRFRGSVSLFQIRRVNALTTDPADPDFSVNTGAQRVRGVEFEGQWQLQQNWSLAGGYAHLNSKITRSNDGDQGLALGDVPGDTYTLRTAYDIPGRSLTLRGGIAHVSDRLLTNGSSVHLPGYTVLDASAAMKVKQINVELLLSNLADKRYFTASGNGSAVIPGDPRSLQLRLGTHW